LWMMPPGLLCGIKRISFVRAVLEIVERKVLALQRFCKRIVEREIFVPVIKQAGLDPKEADCRLNWGMPETPEIEVADIVRLAEISARSRIQYVRPDEVRKMLVKIGFELTEPQQQPGGEK